MSQGRVVQQFVVAWVGVALGGVAFAAEGSDARPPAAGPQTKTFTDPGPPAARELESVPPPAARKNPDATFHAAPKPLAPGAVTHDWKSLLGPNHNYVSDETKLLKKFPEGGPKLVWEVKRGSGYAAPAVLGERLVLIHRVGDEEKVECLSALTGERFWQFTYPTGYVDRYGYSDGPRASPVIGGEGDRWVFTLGVEGKLHCLELATGRPRWQRDLMADFKLKQNFFGTGHTPLVEGEKLIVNVGAPGGPTVAAFDASTGKMLWGAGDQWGESYAAPVPAVVHGKRRVFVFAGGESNPPTGGLMCLDPADGAIDFAFPWRGRRRESVNASAPLVLGDCVFVSESYGSGGALVRMKPDGGCEEVWTTESLGTHFMSAVRKGDYLYGVDGHGPRDAFLVCVSLKDGKEVWRTQPEWVDTVKTRDGGTRQAGMGTYRAWLMPVDARFLCLGEYGHLLWADLTPQGFKELDRAWLFPATESWTPPVLSKGLLYVCQNSQGLVDGGPPRLLCYDMREPSTAD